MKFRISYTQESSDRWRAWVPELPGCCVRGRSQQEIARKIDQAIRGYLASWNVAEPHDLEEELVQVGVATSRVPSVV